MNKKKLLTIYDEITEILIKHEANYMDLAGIIIVLKDLLKNAKKEQIKDERTNNETN